MSSQAVNICMTVRNTWLETLSIQERDANGNHITLQVLANLPSVERMAAAKDLQKFLNKFHNHAYRLVSYKTLVFWGLSALFFSQSMRTFAQTLLQSALQLLI